jgi:hypothetical protein
LKFPKRLRHNERGRVLATIYHRPDEPRAGMLILRRLT